MTTDLERQQGDRGRNPLPTAGGDSMKKVYVASPLGFSTATRLYYDRELLPRLRESGYAPLDPWDDLDGSFGAALGRGEAETDPARRREELARVDSALGERNVSLIQAADAVLAVLDGVDVDSGTASEIGFAFALGKPVVGLRMDFRSTGENEGCSVNLQVEYFIRASGGTIERDVEGALDALGRIVGQRLRGRAGGSPADALEDTRPEER